jgi:hypothetical protein
MLVFGPSSKLFWKLRLVCSLLSKVKRGEPSDSELVLPSFLQDKNVQLIKENKELWLVGENKSNYLNEILLKNHVRHIGPTLEVDKFIHECSETAGILLGRTTIESWMCGKSSWIYNVDKFGNILEKKLYDVPDEVGKYKSNLVSSKIKEEYITLINGI